MDSLELAMAISTKQGCELLSTESDNAKFFVSLCLFNAHLADNRTT